MPATPVTDASWQGLPLLQCDMDPGLYRLSVDVPVLIFRSEPGLIVETATEGGRSLQFRQGAMRFDLFGHGVEMNAISDRPGTKSFVIALPQHWVHAEDAPSWDAQVLRSRLQFADRELWRLVWRLINHHRHGEPLRSAYSAALSRVVVDRVLKLQFADEQQMANDAGLDAEARRVLERLVDEHLHDPPAVAAMAAALGMGVVRFSQSFKAAMGTTPHQYVQQRRIALARRLLAGTDASVAQIALEAGYANQAHFATAFRAATGSTPSDYRRLSGSGAGSGPRPPPLH